MASDPTFSSSSSTLNITKKKALEASRVAIDALSRRAYDHYRRACWPESNGHPATGQLGRPIKVPNRQWRASVALTAAHALRDLVRQKPAPRPPACEERAAAIATGNRPEGPICGESLRYRIALGNVACLLDALCADNDVDRRDLTSRRVEVYDALGWDIAPNWDEAFKADLDGGDR